MDPGGIRILLFPENISKRDATKVTSAKSRPWNSPKARPPLIPAENGSLWRLAQECTGEGIWELEVDSLRYSVSKESGLML